MAWIHSVTRCAALTALSVSLVAMTACANSGSTTTAMTTSACPAAPTTALKTITGTVTKIASGALTVTAVKGAASIVLISATTRYTKLQTAPAATLMAGTSVQVLTQPSASTAPTVAQSIIIQPSTDGQGQDAGGVDQDISEFGQGAGTGDVGQGRGSSTFSRGQGSGNVANCRLQRTSADLGFRGLSGTIKIFNAISQQLVVSDTQGTPFLIAITATTTIDASAQASQADLQTGETVTIRGATTNSSVTARQIQILAVGQGQ